ncbi:MAG: DUF4870 domain-containing protein [Chthoniobacteraceae bacterium]|jgi:uncharacterized protein
MDGPTPTTPAATSDSDRLWGALAHLSALTMYVSGIGFVVGPLIVWLLKRDDGPFIREEAREALNFNISIAIYYACAVALCITIILIPVVVFLVAAIHIFHLICVIVAGIKAYEGRPFRYPLNLDLVK